MKGPRALSRALSSGLGLFGWVNYAVIASAILIAEPQRARPQLAWQYDWHVYLGGAQDLLDRSLYRQPLVLDAYPLPVDVFNQTPVAALWALPLSPFDVITGGNIWLALMVVCIASAMTMAATALGLPLPSRVAGIGLLAYSLSPWFLPDVLLGNINGLMFLLVAAFVWLHLRGDDRAAGLILGIAIATKPWALAFLPLLVRERKWREMRWAGVFVALQGIAFLGWLGVDVVPQMAAAIAVSVPIEPGVPVLGWSLVRETYGLPAWWGVVVGALLLAIPARGRLGLGIAILAGLTLMVVNLWQHYLPVIALGVALLVVPLGASVRDAFLNGRRGPAAAP